MPLPEDNTTPARDAVAVTPADAGDLALGPFGYPRALWVGVGGSIRVDMYGADDDHAGETEVDFVGVTGGSILPIRVRRVWAAGTTATDIVALY